MLCVIVPLSGIPRMGHDLSLVRNKKEPKFDIFEHVGDDTWNQTRANFLQW